MKQIIKTFLPLVEYIDALPKRRRKEHISKLRDNIFKFLIDLLLNVDRGHLPIDGATLEKLRPYKKIVCKLISPKISLKARKQQFQKRDYFKRLISPLIPVLQQALLS